MKGKTGKHFLFKATLNWISADTGILSVKGTEDKISVSTPMVFDGEGKTWSPEQLLLGAVCSSFMTTYLSYAARLGFGITHFECNAIGQVEVVEGSYRFTQIDVYPQIFIQQESLREMANAVLQKTHVQCLVANSLSAEILYHSHIKIAHF